MPAGIVRRIYAVAPGREAPRGGRESSDAHPGVQQGAGTGDGALAPAHCQCGVSDIGGAECGQPFQRRAGVRAECGRQRSRLPHAVPMLRDGGCAMQGARSGEADIRRSICGHALLGRARQALAAAWADTQRIFRPLPPSGGSDNGKVGGQDSSMGNGAPPKAAGR